MTASIEPTKSEQDKVLVLTHRFDAPRSKVFGLWSEKRHILNWWGPEGSRLSHCEIDFREGGAWRFCMYSASSERSHWIRGVYREIRAPELLSFSYINEADGHEMLVTLNFAEVGGKTELRFRQEPFLNTAERDGHGWGWTSTFGLLADYVRRLSGIEGPDADKADGVTRDIAAARERERLKQDRTGQSGNEG